MSETGHFFAFAALQMNSDLFNNMSAEDQEMFTETGFEVSALMGKEQQNNEAAAKQELESLGMVFNEVDDKQAFADLVQPVYDEFLKSHDSKILEAIKALQ